MQNATRHTSCKRDPEDDASEEDIHRSDVDVKPKPKRRRREGGSSKKTLEDFHSDYHSLLRSAAGHYRCLVSTKDAFPDEDTNFDFAADAFASACEERGEKVTLTPEMVRYIQQRASQIRGELKGNARTQTQQVYGFITAPNEDEIKLNKDRYDTLIKKDIFLRKNQLRNPRAIRPLRQPRNQ